MEEEFYLNSGEISPIQPSLSKNQMELCKITFGQRQVGPISKSLMLKKQPISFDMLKDMAEMVNVEFYSSLKKEIDTPEDNESATATCSPNPYDVTLIEPDLSTGNVNLAICVPIKKRKAIKKKKDETKNVMWLDCNRTLWPLDMLKPIRQIGSLSGPSRILDALDERSPLMQAAMDRSFIFEVNEDIKEKSFSLPISGASAMNESQREAVAASMDSNFKFGFFMVLGPPGCGKTTTIVGMIQAAVQSSSFNILVCAPSNAAVANIALKLDEANIIERSNILVFGNNCDKSVHHLNPVHRSEKVKSFLQLYQNEVDNTRKDDLLNKFSQWLKVKTEVNTIEEIFEAYQPTISDDDDGGELLKYISEARVILCTLNSSGSKFLRKSGNRELIFLDEAGQCPEAEFYIACNFPGVRKVVVVGDPKQLPSTVISKECKDVGYGRSWIENAMGFHPQKAHMLDIQYRMDPEIVHFSNIHFYDSRIKNADVVYQRIPSIDNPFQFIDTKKRGMEFKDNLSWRNAYEAATIRALMNTDPDILKLCKNSKKARIVVITPYKSQKLLIESELKKVKKLDVQVATVDSFQGQEADVVIISTVRTKVVGFTDDPQRINVALTRAIRLVRIVGDFAFFESIRCQNSILYKLAQYSYKSNAIHDLKIQRIAASPPDWSISTLWKPRMTQSFHHSLKQLSVSNRYIALNTVIAISTPEIKLMHPRPTERSLPKWNMTRLNQCDSMHVVWIAKQGKIIEAHHAGTRKSCLHFMQIHRDIPVDACCVKADMSDIIILAKDKHEACLVSHLQAWSINNDIQNSICDGLIEDLPQGMFELDERQQVITQDKNLPLLIESRSGTGKTNVLFQHMLANSYNKAVCFVTVSRRLCTELKKRYREVQVISKNKLPSCQFFTLHSLMDQLSLKMNYFVTSCSFQQYFFSRTSHAALAVDFVLLQNEIGGVILGSLEAALKRRPLKREEYMENIRSNISRDQQGLAFRMTVYDEFERYSLWKSEGKMVDSHDQVLHLLAVESLDQISLFDAAYFDEVQDFSYASILLLCKLAGRANSSWIFAGDTAQMIAVGCSFKFDGLKQTLLEVTPGIEKRLKKVYHLLINYRTTADVLRVGNILLDLAKKYFPDSIEYAQPEQATKDNNIKVVLCDWDQAFQTPNLSFGDNQALVCSADENGTKELIEKSNKWLAKHPFILTPVDAKGLEFDDVVVAFNFKRNAWKIDKAEPISLQLLRQLYVAVTRAKQRVVILVKQESNVMKDFFSIYCKINYSDSKVLLTEFDTKTSKEDWLNRGHELFYSEEYLFASKCFQKGLCLSWEYWALGRHFARTVSSEKAAHSLRQCLAEFFILGDYDHVLDVILEIDEMYLQDIDFHYYEKARERCPNKLARVDQIRFAIYQDHWDDIELFDFENPNVKEVFMGKRGNFGLMTKIKTFPPNSLAALSMHLPCIIGDVYFETNFVAAAVDNFLYGGDINKAMDATKKAILGFPHEQNEKCILQIFLSWKRCSLTEPRMPEYCRTSVFLKLFNDPNEAANKFKSFCMRDLGTEIIKFAVRHHSLNNTVLYEFDRNAFHAEVLCALKRQLSPIDIIYWFLNKKDLNNATAYFSSCIQKWTDEEFSDLIVNFSLRPSQSCHESERRALYLISVTLYLELDQIDDALRCSNLLLKSIKSAETYGEAIYGLWCRGKKWEKVKRLKYTINQIGEVAILMDLFLNPKETCKDAHKKEKCKCILGKELVKKAVLQYNFMKISERFQTLFQFDRIHFRPIIQESLEKMHRETPMKVAEWFYDNGDLVTAKQVVKKGLKYIINGNPLKLWFTKHENLNFFLREDIVSYKDILVAKECMNHSTDSSNCTKLSKIFKQIIEALTASTFTKWLVLNDSQNLRFLNNVKFLEMTLPQDDQVQKVVIREQNQFVMIFEAKNTGEKEALAETFLKQIKKKLSPFFDWIDAVTINDAFLTKLNDPLLSKEIYSAIFPYMSFKRDEAHSSRVTVKGVEMKKNTL